MITLCYSCSNRNRERIHNIPLITIDDTKKEDIKNIVYDLEIIELENTIEAWISEIIDIKIVDDKIYCFTNSKGGYIVVFKLSGKFLYKLQNIGNAGNEWISLRSFYIDEEKKRMILSDYAGRKILEYDLDGNFIESHSLGTHDRFEVAMKDDRFYSITSTLNTGWRIGKGSDYKINIYSKDGTFITKYIKTKYNDAPIVRNKRSEFISNFDGDLIYAPILDDIIYKIKKDSVFPHMQFAYKGDKKLITSKKLDELSEKFTTTWGTDNITFFDNNFIETPNIIYRRMGHYEAFDVLYNKHTEQSVVVQFDSPSEGKFGISKSILYPSPHIYYKERFYATFSSQIFNAPEEYVKGKMPDILKDYAKKYNDGKLNNLIFSYKIRL